MKKIFLFTVAVFVFMAGCTTDDTTTSTHTTISSTTTSTLKTGTCVTEADCKTFCITNTSCKQYQYYYVEDRCVDGVCLCRCVEEEMAPIKPPEGNRFVYNDKTYVKTDRILDCDGSLRNVDGVTLWSKTGDGYIYTPYKIDVGEGVYRCHLWVVEPGVLLTLNERDYGQGDPVEISIKDIDVVDKTINPPFYSVERLDEGNWSAVDRINCPCGSVCTTPPLINLSPDETLDYVWNSREEYCNGSVLDSEAASIGEYRIKVYVDGNETAYSRKFRIKPKVNVAVSTDKSVYSSLETMKIKINISSGGDIENVSFRLLGIKGLDEERSFDLKEGEKILNFKYLVPQCSAGSCTVIEPGGYQIVAMLRLGGKDTVSGKKDIRIEPKTVG